jgi:hypothetical protein
MMMSSRASSIEEEEDEGKKRRQRVKKRIIYFFFLMLLFMLDNFVMQDSTHSFLMRYIKTFSYRKTRVNMLSVSTDGWK